MRLIAGLYKLRLRDLGESFGNFDGLYHDTMIHKSMNKRTTFKMQFFQKAQ